MIILYCIASFLIGAWISTIFNKKEEIKEKELPYEEFDPLAVYKDNRKLRVERDSLKTEVSSLKSSKKFYADKFKMLQQAVTEKNNEFVIHELQRMNYEEANRPIVSMSGFYTPISSYTGLYSFSSTAASDFNPASKIPLTESNAASWSSS